MCNLYALTPKGDDLGRFFRVSHNRRVAFEPLPAIFPGYTAPIVRLASDGERELVLMRWGFVLLQQGRAPRRVTNGARRQSSFKQLLAWLVRRPPLPRARIVLLRTERRCEACSLALICAEGERPRPLFAFPGIWRRYKGPIKKDGPNVDIET